MKCPTCGLEMITARKFPEKDIFSEENEDGEVCVKCLERAGFTISYQKNE